MEKNVLIAIVLSLAVLFLYPYLLRQINPPQPAEKAAVEEVRETQAETAAVSSAPEAREGTMAEKPQRAAEAAKPVVSETLATVQTPLYEAVLTNVGGAVKSWKLKKYRETKEKDSPAIDPVGANGSETTNRTSLTANNVTQTVVFEPLSRSVVIDGEEKAELVFTGTTPDGLRVTKKYTFTAWNYTTQTELEIKNTSGVLYNGRVDTVLAAYFNSTEKGRMRYHVGPIVQTAEDLIRHDVDEAKESGEGTVSWIGVEDKYFLNVLIPTVDTPVSWVNEIPSEAAPRSTVRVDLALSPGARGQYGYLAYLGPKDYNLLTAHNVGLGEAIEFGWFSFMAKPMLAILNLFQKYVVNYGIAIIILTVIIKVIFYPLTKHSLSSMKEMQKVQPQLAAVKERYKDNKEKMNKEIMALYKKYKINPLSGCLPMLLQIPVFIALYEVLYVAIELRHAPLFLWITDLSAKDPYYITPLLMGGSMFLQQKMTPTSIDPAQAKIMLLMPVIFTFMFLNFPSGLVLYWLTNNILSVGQQYLINKSPSPSKA